MRTSTRLEVLGRGRGIVRGREVRGKEGREGEEGE